MAHAMMLAARGLNGTPPNPRVGCVIAQGETVIGEGWHRQAGEPHAEVYALQAAGDPARGATAYVTLEPCCHQGRTPPCTEALQRAGIRRVVYAAQDPNPQVNGRGEAALRAAGIEVGSGLLAAESERLHAGLFMPACERANRFFGVSMPALSLFSRCSRHLALLALLTSFANVHAQEAPQMDLPRVELTAGMYRIDAQLAQTPGQRQIGLMHRKSMPPQELSLINISEPTGPY